MSASSDEFAYIQWLRERTPPHERVLVGPGDDAALLQLDPSGQCLVTTDMLMDGVDFRLGEVSPRLVGRKALAVNLSDMAAMAGRPIAAFVSVALPRAGGGALAEEIYLGMREIADAYGTAVAGGDTNTWVGALVISVALIGSPTARGPVLRSGARPGDWLLVTGPLGGSIRGKHLTFMPRVLEALRLHEIADIHALIDISDGLAADVFHVCTESGCGAVLRADAIPISADARLMNDALSPLEHALSDGEDFELVMAVPPEAGQRLVAEQPIPGLTLVAIGECVEKGLWLEDQGKRRPLAPRGFVHAFT